MDETNKSQTVPWERKKELGLLRALWQTTKEVLFHPGEFFDRLVGVTSLSNAFSFYITIIIVSFLIEIIVLALSNFSTLRLLFSALFSFPLIIFLAPIFIVIGIYISTAIMHLFVLVFRGEGGYEGTFNVMAYSCVAELCFFLSAAIAAATMNLFLMIAKFLPPAVKLLGMMATLFIVPIAVVAGLLWMIVIAVVGYTRIHRLSVIRASCAFLIPIIIFGAIQYTVKKKEREKAPVSLEESLERLKQARIGAYEAGARARCTFIRAACQSYFSDKGTYPSSLKDLSSIDPSLAEAINPLSAIEGYYYTYSFLDNDHFTLYTKPAEPDQIGGRVFFIDQSGILKVDGPQGIPVGELEKEEKLDDKIEDLQSQSAFHRSIAAEWLGDHGVKEAVESLVKTLEDKDHFVREKAAEALGKIKDKRAVVPLINTLKDRDPMVKSRTIEALGKIGDIQAIEPLLALLHDKYVQLKVVEALGALKDKRAISPLIDLLKDERVISHDIAKALAEINEPAIGPLTEALKSGNGNVQAGAADALGLIGDSRVIEPLVSALRDADIGDFDLIRNATEALGRIGVEAMDSLFALLNDDNFRVREQSAEALGYIQDERVKTKLLELIQSEEDSLRSGAVKALGMLKDSSFADLLTSLEDKSPFVRENAAEGLGNLKVKDAVEKLLSALKDEDKFVRMKVAWALGEIGDKRAVEGLILVLEDNELIVVGEVASALGKIKDKRAVPYLIATLKREDADLIVNTVYSALQKITGKEINARVVTPQNVYREWKEWWEENK